MGIYGPFTAQLNQVVPVTGLDTTADRLYVENRSVYDLAVAFMDTQPPPVATVSGRPWFYIIPPGGKTVRIPVEYLAGRRYGGTFYVLALNPLGVGQAGTGQLSNNAQFFVADLLPGDVAPNDYTIPQAQNLVSQPRIITLPMAWSHMNSVALAAASYPAFIGPQLLTAAQQAALKTAIYLGYAQLIPDSGVTGNMDFSLGIQFRNASHVNVGGIFGKIFGYVVANGTSGTPSAGWTFAPANPFVNIFNGNIPANATEWGWVVTNEAGTAVNLKVILLTFNDQSNLATAPVEYGSPFNLVPGSVF